MNYHKIYENLIKKGKTRTLENNEYKERHHILPKSLGGLDIPDNLVYLTAKEHFVAHLLLVRIYKNHVPSYMKMSFALNQMSWSNNKKRPKLTSIEYSLVKRNVSIARKLFLNKKRKNGETNKKYYSKIISEKRIDKTIYHFFHKEHGEFVGNCYELSKAFPGLNWSNLKKVALKERSYHKGWILHEYKNIGIEGFLKIKKGKMTKSALDRKNKTPKGRIRLYSPCGNSLKICLEGDEKYKNLISMGWWSKNGKHGSIPKNLIHHKDIRQSEQMKKVWKKDKESGNLRLRKGERQSILLTSMV